MSTDKVFCTFPNYKSRHHAVHLLFALRFISHRLRFSGKPFNVKRMTSSRQLCGKRMRSSNSPSYMRSAQNTLKRNCSKAFPGHLTIFRFERRTQLTFILSTVCCRPPQICTAQRLIHRVQRQCALYVLHNCQLHALFVFFHKTTTQQSTLGTQISSPASPPPRVSQDCSTFSLSAPSSRLAYTLCLDISQSSVCEILILLAARSYAFEVGEQP